MLSKVENVFPDWPERLRRLEASEYLAMKHGVRTAPATLAKLAVTGGGPEYELWGRIPYYRPQELDEWVIARLSRRRSTSDRGGECQGDNRRKLMKRQRAAGATTRTAESHSPAPLPIDAADEIAGRCETQAQIEDISAGGISSGHRKEGAPPPPSTRKAPQVDFKGHQTRSKKPGFSSARRDSEGVA